MKKERMVLKEDNFSLKRGHKVWLYVFNGEAQE